MRRCIALSVALLASAPSLARAAAGTAFADTARVTALGYAVTARPGDPGTMLRNPAGLADVREPTILAGAQALGIVASFARTGEPAEDRSRFTGSYSVAAATPLPGILRDVRVGVALDLPAGYVLRVAVPVRNDTPQSPFYEGRPDRVSALFAAGFPIFQSLRIGFGLAVVPSLATPTEVTYVAGRDPSVDRSVVVRLERDLDVRVVPFFGIRATPTRALSLGFSYRGVAFSRARGSQRTVAGGIVADDPVDFLQFWDPETITLGGALSLGPRVSVSTDVAIARWSRFKSGRDDAVDPRFRDTLAVRAGVEVRGTRWLALRAGGGVESNPVPEQRRETNYLGASTIMLGGGAGFDLRPARVPLSVDLQVSGFFGPTQTATKDASPGDVVSNLGYPGFSASAGAVQFGLTVTLFAGGLK